MEIELRTPYDDKRNSVLVILSHLILAGFGRFPAPTSFGAESILSSTRTTSCGTLLSTGRTSAFTMTWVWFLNLETVEDVE